jgi:mono/diheme cytochrome c family protein
MGTLAAVAVAAGCGGSGSTSSAGGAGGVGGSGAEVYAAKCASCHGADLEGTAKGPSHLSKVYEPSHHSDAAFRRAIAQGSPAHHWNFGAMPPVQGMSEADVTAVIAFIRQQQQARGFHD